MNTSPLFPKNILLGITGSIEAYKTPELIETTYQIRCKCKNYHD